MQDDSRFLTFPNIFIMIQIFGMLLVGFTSVLHVYEIYSINFATFDQLEFLHMLSKSFRQLSQLIRDMENNAGNRYIPCYVITLHLFTLENKQIVWTERSSQMGRRQMAGCLVCKWDGQHYLCTIHLILSAYLFIYPDNFSQTVCLFTWTSHQKSDLKIRSRRATDRRLSVHKILFVVQCKKGYFDIDMKNSSKIVLLLVQKHLLQCTFSDYQFQKSAFRSPMRFKSKVFGDLKLV